MRRKMDRPGDDWVLQLNLHDRLAMYRFDFHLL